MKRRREVLIEIEREIVISSQQHHHRWCPICEAQVQMLTAHEAAKTMNTDEAMIFDEAHAGRLHYTATAEGRLLVCVTSVMERRNETETPRLARLLLGDICEPAR
jgi:hypothetical protein